MSSPIQRLTLPLVALTALLSACNSSSQKASLSVPPRDDEKAIERLIERRQLVATRGDAFAFSNLFTDDAVIMPTNRNNIVGVKAIKQWEQTFAEEFDIETELAIDEIQVMGNWAFVRLRVTGTLLPRLEGDPVKVNGKELAVLQRQPDGTWKISRLMGNSNVSAKRSPLSVLE